MKSFLELPTALYCQINDPRNCPRPKFWLLGQLKVLVVTVTQNIQVVFKFAAKHDGRISVKCQM